MVIDGAVTLTGSMNWTHRAAANSENFNLIFSPAPAAVYLAHWQTRLAVSSPFNRREDWCRASPAAFSGAALMVVARLFGRVLDRLDYLLTLARLRIWTPSPVLWRRRKPIENGSAATSGSRGHSRDRAVGASRADRFRAPIGGGGSIYVDR
jgi:phosphatidylserine/phosphatidylglycerophosphate/cardiolipin synthase-like enzyme